MKLLNILLFLLLVMTGGLASSVNADPVVPQNSPSQNPSPQAPLASVSPDEKTLGAAKELIKVMDFQNMFNNLFTIMSNQLFPLIARDNPGQNERATEIAAAAVKHAFMGHMDEMIANKAIIFAEVFTYDELEQLIQFYQSPLGQKVLTTMPQVMQKTLSRDGEILRAVMRESMQEMVQEFKKNGLKVPKEMGI